MFAGGQDGLRELMHPRSVHDAYLIRVILLNRRKEEEREEESELQVVLFLLCPMWPFGKAAAFSHSFVSGHSHPLLSLTHLANGVFRSGIQGPLGQGARPGPGRAAAGRLRAQPRLRRHPHPGSSPFFSLIQIINLERFFSLELFQEEEEPSSSSACPLAPPPLPSFPHYSSNYAMNSQRIHCLMFPSRLVPSVCLFSCALLSLTIN